MTKSLLSFCLSLFFWLPSKCQETSISFPDRNEGLYFIFQLGYSKGAGKIKLTETTSTRNTGYMVSASATTGYFLSPAMAAGLRIGLNGYHRPDFNLFPVSVSMRYFLKPDRKSIFFNGDLGYSMKLSKAFKSGVSGGLAMGYRLNAEGKVNLLLGAGLRLQHIQNAKTYLYYRQTGVSDLVRSSFWLTSLGFHIGFLF